MILPRPTMRDLLYLCQSIRPDERRQWELLHGAKWDVADAAHGFFNRAGVMFALKDDSSSLPIVAGGWHEYQPGVWDSWMIGTPGGWAMRWRSITKACRKVMDKLMERGARRLETVSIASRTEACDWYVRGLLMHHEATFAQYATNGEDAVLYARVRGGAQ